MLNSQDLAYINNAMAEAYNWVSVPVTFHKASVATTDTLYGEGTETWPVYAALKGAVKVQPTDEYLTKRGLFTGADFFVFIPQKYIKDWEAANGSLILTEDMEISYNDTRYNIRQIRNDDLLPHTLGTDYIGITVTGRIKPM